MHFQAIQVSSFSKQSKSRYSPGFGQGPRFFPCSSPFGDACPCLQYREPCPLSTASLFPTGVIPIQAPTFPLVVLTLSSRSGSSLLSWAGWEVWRRLPCLALSRGALQIWSFFVWTLLSMPMSEAWSLQSHQPPAGGERDMEAEPRLCLGGEAGVSRKTSLITTLPPGFLTFPS